MMCIILKTLLLPFFEELERELVLKILKINWSGIPKKRIGIESKGIGNKIELDEMNWPKPSMAFHGLPWRLF